MRNYENNLDMILERLRTYGIRSFPSCDLPLSSQELIFLSAKGLIKLNRYKNNDTDYKITITNKGITYFEDKKDRIINRAITVFVSVVTTLITTMALKYLGL